MHKDVQRSVAIIRFIDCAVQVQNQGNLREGGVMFFLRLMIE